MPYALRMDYRPFPSDDEKRWDLPKSEWRELFHLVLPCIVFMLGISLVVLYILIHP